MQMTQDPLDDVLLPGSDSGNDFHGLAALPADPWVIVPNFADESGPRALPRAEELWFYLSFVGWGTGRSRGGNRRKQSTWELWRRRDRGDLELQRSRGALTLPEPQFDRGAMMNSAAGLRNPRSLPSSVRPCLVVRLRPRKSYQQWTSAEQRHAAGAEETPTIRHAKSLTRTDERTRSRGRPE